MINIVYLYSTLPIFWDKFQKELDELPLKHIALQLNR